MAPYSKSTMANSPIRTLRRESFLCTAGVLIVCSLAILYTYGDYGVPFDDTYQAVYGKLVAKYFRSGFQDKSSNHLLDTRYYGPVFELLTSFAFVSGNYPIFEWRRLFIALTGMATVLGVIQMAKRLHVPLAPTFAVLALIMMPRFYGHSFINSKDIPFACAFTWLQVILCGRLEHPRLSWGGVFLTGLGCGLVFATRPGSLPLVLLLMLLIVGYMGLVADSPLHSWRKAHGAWQLIVKGLAAVLIGWGIMILFWPWAHENPIANPIRSMVKTVGFHNIIKVLFNGTVYMSNGLPWYYLPKTILITTPIVTIFLAALGLVHAVRMQMNRSARPQSIILFMIEIWVLAPILFVIIIRPNLYDGLRHFLFILPAMALLAGFGAARLATHIKTTAFRTLIPAGLLVLLALPLISIIGLHPSQYCYYNVSVGGLQGASGRYETDYWMTSYKEAAVWINERVKQRFPNKKRLRLLVAANVLSVGCIDYYLDKSIHVTTVFKNDVKGPIPEPFHFYVSTTRFGFDKNFDKSHIVKKIGRKGVIFCVIKEVI